MKIKICLILFQMLLFRDLEASYVVRDEVIDWSMIAGAGAGAYALHLSPYLTDEPLIGGRTDLSYKKDTVPMLWVIGGCTAAGVSILAMPNSDGYMNKTTYMNVKGYSAALAFNGLFTNVAKTVAGRKRPSYDNYTDKNEGRKSFYSGHSSFAFTTAAYLSMFIINNTGNGKGYEMIPKAAVPVMLFSTAAVVAATRVIDHKHNISDVVAGGIAGTIIGIAAYRWANSSYAGKGTPAFGLSSGRKGNQYSMNLSFAF